MEDTITMEIVAIISLYIDRIHCMTVFYILRVHL